MCSIVNQILILTIVLVELSYTIRTLPEANNRIDYNYKSNTSNGKDRRTNIFEWFFGIFGFGTSTNGTNNPNLQCSKCVCGVTNKRIRIIGGVETHVNQYPWMAALFYNNRFVCGGSLISSKYVLTAGHCVGSSANEQFYAVISDHDISTTLETQSFKFNVEAVIRHAAYGLGNAYNNDIALLRLKNPVNITEGLIRPVCLPPIGRSFTGETGTVIGWGSRQTNGPISNTLQEVKVPIWSNADCRQTTEYGNRISDNMLCAGYKAGMKDSCQGDSGGPLHVINGTFHMVSGIVSWGEDCAKPNFPGVYTRVNRYITWIRANTRDSCYCSNDI